MTNPQHYPSGTGPVTGEPVRERPVPPVDVTATGETEAEHRAKEQSIGELFSSFTEHLSALFRKEVQLAKAEATTSVKQAGAGAGMFVGAAVAGLLLLIFVSMSLMWALGEVMHLGLAALIVAVIWGVIAAVLAVVGKNRMQEIKGLEQTQETLQEIPPTLNPKKETP
ncbi:phage holin family protein [Tessaracoccus oleiagri]|uniref:Putative Holin-X, holin superfamily III n=1 Tax=Tessaracoccus oleiagri TaxID=686624 RepID=A0A1G9HA28_9ACTN|nr:phage holin family protein [Tessaracoccus oleiagri]SDL09760.1 Putative Holin-X, holin superfamily III [Tessaracoccus oleiagri]